MKYKIKELREDKDIKQVEIAKILNITQQQYSKIENEISMINAEQLIILSKFYNVSIDYILNNTIIKKDNSVKILHKMLILRNEKYIIVNK